MGFRNERLFRFREPLTAPETSDRAASALTLRRFTAWYNASVIPLMGCRFGIPALRVRVRLVILACVVASIAPPAASQSGRFRNRPLPQRDGKDTIHLMVEEVLLPVSVHSDEGRRLGLTASDLIVLEDGKRQAITSVMRTPANVLLVLDTGGDVTPLKNVNINRDLALKLIGALGESDRAAILTYADKVNLICDWTGDKRELREALDWKFRPGLKSRFVECLLYASEQVLPRAAGRRSVVLVTDGIESFNSTLFNEALAAFHRVRATVYVVSHTGMLLSELRPRVYNKFSWYDRLDPQKRERNQQLRRYVAELEAAEPNLNRMAVDTGGWMWNPSDREEFEALNTYIVGEIDLEYVVAYLAQQRPGDEEFHTVSVYATRPGLTVRSRRGIIHVPRRDSHGSGG